MKKSILTLAVVALAFVSCKEEKKKTEEAKKEVKEVVKKEVENKGNVDTDNSTVLWKGFKPTGSHNGSVGLKSGNIVVENGNVKSGEFTIDMSSIKVLDIPADKAGNGDLVGHLTSADFFDIAKFPTAKFVVTSSEAKEGKVMVTGDLTIKDVTKSVTIPASVSEVGGVVNFNSEVFKINRADFNIKYKSKSFFDNLKDKFINDEVEMSFSVMAK
mgnify:FL=1